MRVSVLLQQVRNVLQDQEGTYWDDSELLGYYNECKRSMASERLEMKTTATLVLDPLVNEYSTNGILRYIRCSDDNETPRSLYPNDSSGDEDTDGVVIMAYNKVYVNDPTVGSTLTFQIVALPPEDNLTQEVRFNDENSFKYYILSKAYEKETDTENFQKSEIFYSKFKKEFNRLIDAASANYTISTVETTAASYY